MIVGITDIPTSTGHRGSGEALEMMQWLTGPFREPFLLRGSMLLF